VTAGLGCSTRKIRLGCRRNRNRNGVDLIEEDVEILLRGNSVASRYGRGFGRISSPYPDQLNVRVTGQAVRVAGICKDARTKHSEPNTH
jgi:hypothetical protein